MVSGFHAAHDRPAAARGPASDEEEATINARNALVGGGSAGIGYAVAEQLLGSGHRVVITGRRAGPLESAASRLAEKTGGTINALVNDVAEPEAAAAALAEVERLHGPLDVLVLNAGGPPPGRVLDVDDEHWQRAFELLLLGPLRLARLALPAMAARGFGRVVFVTSGAVRQPQPDLATSVVLRSAVTAAAKLLSREFASDGVTVNCVAPGATATERRHEILAARARTTGVGFEDLDAADAAGIPAGRAGRPEEIGAAVAFLASAAASYINGTVLTVDGGRTETI
ncbi:SDR family oxidoreductase [Catenulispora sp. NF23]|uniref:SDR family oxidoreductase n=1 Tax=Catenulispora pinistramenti TaxID=2705254 RepID=UPI001BA5E7BA|nr:SDR family oxidoreductase [Catenulispora pinistramenti]MBS2533466.1 SDR family oxidoreductase [Catenulispora pinistramenti]